MSKLKAALLVIFIGVIAAVVAGGIGSATATALLTQFYNREVRPEPLEEIVVESHILGEVRSLRVHLPIGYHDNPDASYPLILVLDGGSNTSHTAHTADVLYRVGIGEEVVVVGVANGDAGRSVDFIPPDVEGGDRQRGDAFLEFIDSEALPALERELRLDGRRILAGHSLGGLFVTYSLIERPSLFDARFAFSPSWWADDRAILKDLEAFLVGNPDLETNFYTSLGAEEMFNMRSVFEAGTEVLERSAPTGLRWQADITPSAHHGNNAVLSTAAALKQFWGG